MPYLANWFKPLHAVLNFLETVVKIKRIISGHDNSNFNTRVKEVKVSLSKKEIKDNQERYSSQMDLKLIGWFERASLKV